MLNVTRTTTAIVLTSAVVAFSWACGQGGSTPTSPTTAATPAPTAPTPAPAPSLSLAGNWSGNIVPIDSTGAEPAAWVATQTGTSVTGPITITSQRTGNYTATLSGTLSGSSLSVTWSLSGRPGAPAGCTETGTGTGSNVTANAITVQIQRTYSAACASAVPSLTPSPDRLTLTK